MRIIGAAGAVALLIVALVHGIPHASADTPRFVIPETSGKRIADTLFAPSLVRAGWILRDAKVHTDAIDAEFQGPAGVARLRILHASEQAPGDRVAKGFAIRAVDGADVEKLAVGVAEAFALGNKIVWTELQPPGNAHSEERGHDTIAPVDRGAGGITALRCIGLFAFFALWIRRRKIARIESIGPWIEPILAWGIAAITLILAGPPLPVEGQIAAALDTARAAIPWSDLGATTSGGLRQGQLMVGLIRVVERVGIPVRWLGASVWIVVAATAPLIWLAGRGTLSANARWIAALAAIPALLWALSYGVIWNSTITPLFCAIAWWAAMRAAVVGDGWTFALLGAALAAATDTHLGAVPMAFVFAAYTIPRAARPLVASAAFFVGGICGWAACAPNTLRGSVDLWTSDMGWWPWVVLSAIAASLLVVATRRIPGPAKPWTARGMIACCVTMVGVQAVAAWSLDDFAGATVHHFAATAAVPAAIFVGWSLDIEGRSATAARIMVALASVIALLALWWRAPDWPAGWTWSEGEDVVAWMRSRGIDGTTATGRHGHELRLAFSIFPGEASVEPGSDDRRAVVLRKERPPTMPGRNDGLRLDNGDAVLIERSRPRLDAARAALCCRMEDGSAKCFGPDPFLPPPVDLDAALRERETPIIAVPLHADTHGRRTVAIFDRQGYPAHRVIRGVGVDLGPGPAKHLMMLGAKPVPQGAWIAFTGPLTCPPNPPEAELPAEIFDAPPDWAEHLIADAPIRR